MLLLLVAAETAQGVPEIMPLRGVLAEGYGQCEPEASENSAPGSHARA
jgi:hypothetical protein